MPNMSKIYANSVAKYLEAKLLTEEKVRRLLDSNYEDALRMVYECGYGDGMVDNRNDIDAVLANETNLLIEFILDTCSNHFVAECLVAPYLFHNAKIIYKSKFVKLNKEESLYMAIEDLSERILGKDYLALDEFMASSLAALDDTENVTSLDIDIALTKAMYAYQVDRAKKSKNKTLKLVVESQIDVNNFITLIRSKKLALTENAVKDMLLAGGVMSVERMIGLYGKNVDDIITEYSLTRYCDIITKLLNNLDVPSILETEIDNYITSLTYCKRDDMLSEDAFLHYIRIKTMEIKVIKMLLICIKNSVPKSEIWLRVRRIYE